MSHARSTALLLNAGHALDHLFLLIFATAVAAIAADWGMVWQDLMPYTVGAFVMFGLGSLPAGRLGDLWGRRAMMVVFFLGMGASGLLIATTSGVWSLAAALTLMGVFSSIYHPVGIPMLVQQAKNPGFTIGVNGLFGNLGIAVAAILCGFLFLALVPNEEMAPARRPKKSVDLPRSLMARVLLVMTLAAVSSSLIFNFTTNGNGQLLAERLRGLIDDPATLGVLLAAVYTVASFAQLVVGKLIDRYPLKYVYLPIVAMQVPLFLLAAGAGGWPLYVTVLAFMVFVFGAIPFVDAMIVQYVDDQMRSRVAGMRLAVSFGVSSLAVYLLGPTVKAAGFSTLLTVMAGISAFTTLCVALLPGRIPTTATAAMHRTTSRAAPRKPSGRTSHSPASTPCTSGRGSTTPTACSWTGTPKYRARASRTGRCARTARVDDVLPAVPVAVGAMARRVGAAPQATARPLRRAVRTDWPVGMGLLLSR